MPLAKLRRHLDLTQEALAIRANMLQETISALERGTVRTPRRSTVNKLAVALRTDPDTIREAVRAAARRRTQRLRRGR